MSDTKLVSIRIPVDLVQKIDAEAAMLDRARNWVIERRLHASFNRLRPMDPRAKSYDRDVVLPEAMRVAAQSVGSTPKTSSLAVQGAEAAIRALAKSPLVPLWEELNEIAADYGIPPLSGPQMKLATAMCVGWQSLMFYVVGEDSPLRKA
jgi:hypothetical protein